MLIRDVLSVVAVEVNDNQSGALVSFTFNLGLGNLRSSTLLKKLNPGDTAGAAEEFPRWVRANGNVLPGLVKRRAAERQLFLTNVKGSTPWSKESVDGRNKPASSWKAFSPPQQMIGADARSTLLSVSGSPPANGRPRCYSLARFQMAWWFAIVFSSYVGLWLMMHDPPAIPAVILGLIGISAGTTIAARGIEGASSAPAPNSEGFWRDLATDENGTMSLPRIQQIGWTLLFGVIFIKQAIVQLAMPEFDSSILLLMGVSAGTYLLGKVPEVQHSAPADSSARRRQQGSVCADTVAFSIVRF